MPNNFKITSRLSEIRKIYTVTGGKDKYLEKTAFHFACENGHSRIAELLIHKSAELNIELNAKDFHGMTAFHFACKNGHYSKIAEMLVQKSTEFNTDLNGKDEYGRTGFHLACINGDLKLAEMLIQNSKNFLEFKQSPRNAML